MKITQNSPFSITACAPAKVNLFLHLYERRRDGYHDIDTYFQLLDLADEVTITLTKNQTVCVDNPAITTPIENELCYRAAMLFFDQLMKKSTSATINHLMRGAHIRVHKAIPDGAGLGGGSSDAASVLLMLNYLFLHPLSLEELLQIGQKIGADVSVFILGKSTFATGVGDDFYQADDQNSINTAPLSAENLATIRQTDLPLKQLNALNSPLAVLVVQPVLKLKTKDIFASKQLTKRVKTSRIPRTVVRLGDNDFTDSVLNQHESLKNLLRKLSSYEHFFLTGTGACLFAITEQSRAIILAKMIKQFESVADVFITKPLPISPLYSLRPSQPS